MDLLPNAGGMDRALQYAFHQLGRHGIFLDFVPNRPGSFVTLIRNLLGASGFIINDVGHILFWKKSLLVLLSVSFSRLTRKQFIL